MPRRRRARATGTIDLRLGANLRALRLMSGRTTEELAAALDVSVQQMGKYERRDDGIAAATLFTLSRLLGTSIHRFYDGLSAVGGVAEEGQPFDRTGAPDIARTSLLRALAAASLTDRRRAVKAALEALATPPG